MARWALPPTCLASSPLLFGFRTYETSLLVEEAISEELPYSGNDRHTSKAIFTRPQSGLV